MIDHMVPKSMSIVKATLVHMVLGVVVLVALFSTVHNRDTQSATFEQRWVESGIFSERWNDLSDHWRDDGWWANGGMWYLNQCDWFARAKKAAWIVEWVGDQPVDTDTRHYYYRSNTMLWLAPLHVTQSAVTWIRGGSARRWVLVLHNQVWPMLTAVLLGLSGTLLARRMGMRWIHGLALGISCQIVLQTAPVNLGAYWGFYMQHAFALAMMMVLLSFVIPRGRARLLIRIFGVAAMVLADLPHALMLIAAWAGLNLMISPRLFSRQRWLTSVVAPAVIALLLLAMQYAVVMIATDRSSFIGSGLMFRTGLDGDITYFQSLWEGAFGFIFKSPLSRGAPLAAEHAILWVLGGLACVATLLIGARRRDLGHVCYMTMFLGVAFIPFFVLFPNAVAIHPHAYPVIALPMVVFGLFAALPIAVQGNMRRKWPLILTVVLTGLVMTAANLRSYAIDRPVEYKEAIPDTPLTHATVTVTYKAGRALKQATGTLKAIERDYIWLTIGSGEDMPIFMSDLVSIWEADDATPGRWPHAR